MNPRIKRVTLDGIMDLLRPVVEGDQAMTVLIMVDGTEKADTLSKRWGSAARVHRESIEYYIGHSLGLAGRYTAEHGLHLDDVANAIPDPRKLVAVDFAKKKRGA